MHSSPDAVWDAFREAEKNGDWRTVWFCLLPEERNRLAFGLLFVCGTAGNQDVQAVLKAYGVAADDPTWADDHLEGLQIDHAWCRRKAIEVCETWPVPGLGSKPADENVVAAGPDAEPIASQLDRRIDAVARQYESAEIAGSMVVDKVGFFAAAMNVLMNRTRERTLIGKLEEVTIDGETATGHADVTSVYGGEKGGRKRGRKRDITD
jgi:hypothetical protein